MRPTVIDASARSPVILHAPHGSTFIPAAYRPHFLIDDAALKRELLALTDHRVDRMVRGALEHTDASAVIAEVSRLAVDVERFPDDTEEMNAVGMGVLYTHGAWRDRIRSVPADARRVLLQHFNAYSRTIERLVDRALERQGRAVIIDVHSYPTRPLPYELHAADARPPLCVGYDARHMTDELLAHVRLAFADLEQADNVPFAGAYVPLSRFGRDERVQAVMLEVRRDQYMDEVTGEVDPAAMTKLSTAIAGLANYALAEGDTMPPRR